MLKATISIKKDAETLYKLFSFEDKDFGNERANYELKLQEDELFFLVKAKDSVALRSVLNTITKLLSVYEKTLKVLSKWGY